MGFKARKQQPYYFIELHDEKNDSFWHYFRLEEEWKEVQQLVNDCDDLDLRTAGRVQELPTFTQLETLDTFRLLYDL